LEADKSHKTCTMIITEPNKFVAEVHDRMPVLLAEKDYEPWLSGKAGLGLLKPAADNVLQKWPVSKRVNSSRAPDDDPTLIDKIAIGARRSGPLPRATNHLTFAMPTDEARDGH
jgi:putative SOS response-associated peptidase YedK